MRGGFRTALLLTVIASSCPTAWAAPIQWLAANGGNDHWYEPVYISRYHEISWEQARTDAANRYPGAHLVTITSQAENDFVFSLVWPIHAQTNLFYPWLGGYQEEGQAAPDAGWRWVTGEPFVYTNWREGEPNDFGSRDETWLEMVGYDGGWNDQFFYDAAGSGYVLEYGSETVIPLPAPLWLLGAGFLAYLGLGASRRQGR